MTAKVIDPNPYGKTTLRDVENFEQRHGLKLPVEYVQYLVDVNGGGLKNCVFPGDGTPYSDFKINNFLALGEVPDYASLESGFNLVKNYDLSRFARRLRHFFVFAHCSSGNPLAFDLRYGAIWYYQNDHAEPSWFWSFKRASRKLANSFGELHTVLMSEEAHQQKLSQEPGYEQFQEQLKALKHQRAEEVARGDWDQ